MGCVESEDSTRAIALLRGAWCGSAQDTARCPPPPPWYSLGEGAGWQGLPRAGDRRLRLGVSKPSVRLERLGGGTIRKRRAGQGRARVVCSCVLLRVDKTMFSPSPVLPPSLHPPSPMHRSNRSPSVVQPHKVAVSQAVAPSCCCQQGVGGMESLRHPNGAWVSRGGDSRKPAQARATQARTQHTSKHDSEAPRSTRL